ncbi:MAG: phosphoglycerate mutase family protein [Propionibacteriaceae bacterium]|nr:phosphoglycerate mutase family protein [Propionibacteriaceae bacterium]
MKLLLIRHGQSLANLAWLQGEPIHGGDPVLTELGEIQAQSLAHAFSTGLLPRPDYVFSSLMQRAVQTVAPVAQVLGCAVEGTLDGYEVGGLHHGSVDESDVRAFPGLGTPELLSICPQLVLPDEVNEQGWYFREVETRVQGWVRAQRLFAQLVDRFGDTDACVVLVCHGMFIQLFLRTIIGWEPDLSTPMLDDAWFTINNTGSVYLTVPGEYGERATIHWVNRVDHLIEDHLSD